MPKRSDIKKVLVIGAGPVVIGQAAEFDYSGSQALKSIREEGLETVVVNSNPATIQTDTDMADSVYIEPLTLESLTRIIEKEKPDGVLSSFGGQTGLNLTAELADAGVLEKNGVEILGTPLKAIKDCEDRKLFKDMMIAIDEPIPESGIANSIDEARKIAEKVGFPVIVRPAYTLGGTGGGIADNMRDLENIAAGGIANSRIGQILIEECVTGWKEIEYEVMRDSADNCITVCNMENFDPVGIHTGDSIVVAPSQTLTDKEYQMLRSASLKIIRALKVEGGCNIQFALDPKSDKYIVIEVNPRVSRSSALASKATGYPIALIAAKISIGMTLDEIENPITEETKASFEPALDYIVTKIPRWPFEKFYLADRTLGTEMRSTGEVMAIGRTFEESIEKAVASLDIDKESLVDGAEDFERLYHLEIPTHKRLFYIASALKKGMDVMEINKLTGIDPWFLNGIKKVFSKRTESNGFKMVDTCAAEFAAKTPYFYSAEGENEAESEKKKKVMILGSGPIRIGQGIEFDYSTVHALGAIKEEGIESIIINNNPETVSTDYDTSDRLYFEPLTFSSVMRIIDNERPYGVMTQFGGQTSVNLSLALEKAGVNILGTSPKDMDRAEDRDKFSKVVKKLGIPQAENGVAHSLEEAKGVIERIGYPVLIRPSYVIGGRAMEIVFNDLDLERYISEAVKVSKEHPVLIDEFLGSATEIDVDAVSDGTDTLIGGIMEHIEQAGIHSGDSSCVTPTQTLTKEEIRTIKKYTRELARELGIKGLLNIQYAVRDSVVYVLEVNPRSSRTVPFISKASGIQLAKIAAKVMLGKSLKELAYVEPEKNQHVSVKSVVFPFNKIPGSDIALGPEMKSTGEAMGIADNFPIAYYKAQLGAGLKLPENGKIFFAVRNRDKEEAVEIAREFENMGFKIAGTGRTAKILRINGIQVQKVLKPGEGVPDIVSMIKGKGIDLVINTPTTAGSQERAGYKIRRACIKHAIPCITTMSGAGAALEAIKFRKYNGGSHEVMSLQDYHRKR
ncbi:TPA: carbamoyl-phosphate synthase large subunit [archaeon]|jgi:carbamoyl-phosphate synthase large subunit|uniref:Carbamoyl phosphate synthase large chain n=1 Tax=Candidatus Undinarchaeum marinum TaxID=2756141 RepID=A0A832ULB7_9ARCH|nr:carbamoyl-phosphate synthase large subunit [Candidatus Undinarchaeum marinum]